MFIFYYFITYIPLLFVLEFHGFFVENDENAGLMPYNIFIFVNNNNEKSPILYLLGVI